MAKTRYHFWYSDIDGNENAMTVMLNKGEFDALQARCESLKRRSEPVLSDFTLQKDSPSTYQEAEAWLNDIEDTLNDC